MTLVESLYTCALKTVTTRCPYALKNIRKLPDRIAFDIVHRVCKTDLATPFAYEVFDLTLFEKLLAVPAKKCALHDCFQLVVNRMDKVATHTTPFLSLVNGYRERTQCSKAHTDEMFAYNVELGLNVARFFHEAGWYEYSRAILEDLMTYLNERREQQRGGSWSSSHTKLTMFELDRYAFDAACEALSASILDCDFSAAKRVVSECESCATLIRSQLTAGRYDSPLLARFYAEKALLHYNLSEYAMAYACAYRALEALRNLDDSLRFTVAIQPAVSTEDSEVVAKNTHDGTPAKSSDNVAKTTRTNATLSLSPRTVIAVLRSVSKICVVRRQFEEAQSLISYAQRYARVRLGARDPLHAAALEDYAFYLLTCDYIADSVSVNRLVCALRETVFPGRRNLLVAIAHENLAYALYVLEYSSGRFGEALEHAELATATIRRIVPDTHLHCASMKRVKALILEEIAIDSGTETVQRHLLEHAHRLHQQSLKLALAAFGENNVQTAKHYGNLGRLYQSMRRFPDAELMHRKAIEIKERLLGRTDYEVALSVGHLASLYNYDMQKYDLAEQLYLRSIEIGRTLFGAGYSGLEYDYRGLVKLYTVTSQVEKMLHYRRLLAEWTTLHRDSHNTRVPLLSQVLGVSPPPPFVGGPVRATGLDQALQHLRDNGVPVPAVNNPVQADLVDLVHENNELELDDVATNGSESGTDSIQHGDAEMHADEASWTTSVSDDDDDADEDVPPPLTAANHTVSGGDLLEVLIGMPAHLAADAAPSSASFPISEFVSLSVSVSSPAAMDVASTAPEAREHEQPGTPTSTAAQPDTTVAGEHIEASNSDESALRSDSHPEAVSTAYDQNSSINVEESLGSLSELLAEFFRIAPPPTVSLAN